MGDCGYDCDYEVMYSMQKRSRILRKMCRMPIKGCPALVICATINIEKNYQ